MADTERIVQTSVEEIVFTRNKSSSNARKILDRSEQIEIQLWYDQHYYKRVAEGDVNGERKGIDEMSVRELVVKTIKHLLYYSLKVKTFVFINFENKSNRYIRVVLQEQRDKGMLNIAVEFHHLAHNHYEVTVVTAMMVDSFFMGEGQYAIEIIGDTSILNKQEHKKLREISRFN